MAQKSKQTPTQQPELQRTWAFKQLEWLQWIGLSKLARKGWAKKKCKVLQVIALISRPLARFSLLEWTRIIIRNIRRLRNLNAFAVGDSTEWS
jgi:hypothetical protein